MSFFLRPVLWFYHEFGIDAVHHTGRNAYCIILARTCRMFAFGTNSLVLAIFFSALGFSDHRIGVFMTLTLAGDLLLGTFLTLIADRVGRRKVLVAGSILMVSSGIVFAIFENFWLLLMGAIAGVISITGGDFGPFRSIEESIISQLTTTSNRADVLAWYVTLSTLGSALGSEVAGRAVHALQERDGWTDVDAYHALFWVYAATGLINLILTVLLTEACELNTKQDYAQIPQDETDQSTTPATNRNLPLGSSILETSHSWHRRARLWLVSNLAHISAPTRSIMFKLWALLAVDSMADGMVPYSLTNYYMDIKFHPSKSTLGDVTSISYFLGAIGSTFAGPLARRIGLINTMVFTHIPSSTAVLLFPFPPYFWMTAGLLFLRTALNPMDQAPRSAFIAAVVRPEERTAVMGITSMVRTLASMAGPLITGAFAAEKLFWIAFVIAGINRLCYDFGLYAMFVNMKINEDTGKEIPTTPRTTDMDEEYELESPRFSLGDSSDEDDDKSKRGAREAGVSVNQLPAPETLNRVRSRSPHQASNSQD